MRLLNHLPLCKVIGGLGYLALRILVWGKPQALEFAGGWPVLIGVLTACALLAMPFHSPVVNITGLFGMVALVIIEAKYPEWSLALRHSGIDVIIGLASFVMMIWEPARPKGNPN
ncbi:hypothetical protein JS533_007675 [Bifidobacterium amazonense]|uniref:Uncharacterized protein n=1 Tax=Bifidobacterium amazonense TaxID=2809027 RepID=A0ABS9VVP6_9BIFI|nr:hypothetical protein [Bifidobacterium amazonense]MCH9276148.1 hypothetical protein [Bifidobacterium amazonense]